MYQFKAGSDSLRASFSAELENVDRVMRQIGRFLKKTHLEDKSFVCELVAREALNNAVLHGCGNDPLKRVKFIFQIRRKDIRMQISDGGRGFPWRDHMYRHPELSSTSGRGLLILKTYVSEIDYSGTGNELVLTIPLHTPVVSSGAIDR